MKKVYFSLIVVFFWRSFSTNIFVSSIPKSGTHLLIKIIAKITQKKSISCSYFLDNDSLPILNINEFIAWHVPYSIAAEAKLKQEDYKCIFLYRDPRDQLISYIFFNLKMETNQILIDSNLMLYPWNFDSLLILAINNVLDFYNTYINWIKSEMVLSIKFEDLVGSKGGGSDELQEKTLIRICQQLQISFDDNLINNCLNNLYGGTATFREGKIGSWKKYFKEEHKELFKKVSGQLLIDLGYEKDFNW